MVVQADAFGSDRNRCDHYDSVWVPEKRLAGY